MATAKKPRSSTARAPGKKPARKPTAAKATPRRAPAGQGKAKKSSTRAKAPGATSRKSGPRKSGPRKASPRKAPATRAPRKAAPRAAAAPPPENAEALALARRLAALALDKKAGDVVALDLRAKGHLVGYDYLVLASADSDRQMEAIADAFREALKPEGRRALGQELSPDWLLVDFGDVVVHLFTPERREVYDLEGMWADAGRVPLEA
jgi:ribosome-associated protein